MISQFGEVWVCPWVNGPTPEELFRILAGQPHVAWLDSAANPHGLGRYSYMAKDPWKVISGRVGRFSVGGTNSFSDDPWQLWENQQSPHSKPDLNSSLPPFQGGWIFSLGYELGRTTEQLPKALHDEFETPDFWAGAYDTIVAWDHEEGQCFVISSGKSAETESDRPARASALILDMMSVRPDGTAGFPRRSLVEVGPFDGVSVRLPRYPDLVVYSPIGRSTFEENVARVVEFIHAGDCFQVNLAQRLLSRLEVAPEELYLTLRRVNPAPFAGYLDLGDTVVASASPERFLRLGQEGWVETRPIKGTRRRGTTPAEDDALARELLVSVKDRAENVMIVDLMRNDLGRVCRPGSISVDEVCRLESYRTVHHLVSVIRGRLREDKKPGDLLRATFPGGSVTGAPKIRAMEIITELETVARGPYCGSLGWLGDNQQMDTNILIRTFTAKGGWVQFPVGGGIVADSIPAQEYEETLHKAEGLLRAILPRIGGLGVNPNP